MKTVFLSQYELLFPAFIGSLEITKAITSGVHRDNTPNVGRDQYDRMILGLQGEIAFCKAYDLYWSYDPEGFRMPDANGVQIRTTDYKSGHLPIRGIDRDLDKFVLVIANRPKFSIVGWMDGKSAKQEKFFKRDIAHPCFMVPQGELFKLESLYN